MTSPGGDFHDQERQFPNADGLRESDAAERPFRVSVSSQHAGSSTEETEGSADDATDEFDDISMDDIEAAYLRALETADAATSALPDEFQPAEVGDALEENASQFPSAEYPSGGGRREQPADAVEDDDFQSEEGSSSTLRAEQVLEGLLFVGGSALTVKRMAEILGGSHTSEQIEETLSSLNSRYLDQARPYEIALVEGGYRMQLKEPFESVRRKVYGQGPKEVKLGQDALEVLAVIAYRQPITRAALEETGKPGLSGLLRQLLRRQLISLDRETGSGEGYRTTPRFLDLFGLTSLDALPQAADFNFR